MFSPSFLAQSRHAAGRSVVERTSENLLHDRWKPANYEPTVTSPVAMLGTSKFAIPNHRGGELYIVDVAKPTDLAAQADGYSRWDGNEGDVSIVTLATGEVTTLSGNSGRKVQVSAMDPMRRVWFAGKEGGSILDPADGNSVTIVPDLTARQLLIVDGMAYVANGSDLLELDTTDATIVRTASLQNSIGGHALQYIP